MDLSVGASVGSKMDREMFESRSFSLLAWHHLYVRYCRASTGQLQERKVFDQIHPQWTEGAVHISVEVLHGNHKQPWYSSHYRIHTWSDECYSKWWTWIRVTQRSNSTFGSLMCSELVLSWFGISWYFCDDTYDELVASTVGYNIWYGTVGTRSKYP